MEEENNQSNNPIDYSPPFSDMFDEMARPLGDVPAAHGSGIRSLGADERMLLSSQSQTVMGAQTACSSASYPTANNSSSSGV